MTTDLLMNECGDIDITDGKLSLVRDGDQVKQAWLIHMRVFLGEYFLDASIGVPYFQQVFGKLRTIKELKEIFIAASLEVPGILQVTECVIGDINPTTREIDISITCKLEGNVTGSFRFTGAIPIGGCDVPTPVQQSLGTGWFWFDPTDTEKSFLNSNPALVVQNALTNKTGGGEATIGGFGFASPTQQINSLRSFFSPPDGFELEIEDLFAPRASMFSPVPSPYEEQLEVFMVVQPPDGLGGVGLITLLGATDAGAFQAIVLSLVDDSPISYKLLVEYVDGGGRTTLASPAGLISKGQTSNLTLTIDRQANTDLIVTVRRNGSVAGPPTVNVGVPTWQSNGELFISSNVNLAGSPVSDYEGAMGEVLGYRELLTDADRDAINQALVDKWKD